MSDRGGLKVDGAVSSQLADITEAARKLERRGYDCCWTAEINHDPFLPLVLAAEHTTTIELGTSIAVAFARNPMTVANIGWDLHAFSNGRFILGLGSQIKPHIEKRFSMPWSQPVQRMREFVLALREIWSCWQDGTKLRFEGDFYTHKLMTPMFTPEPLQHPFPKVFVAAVGEAMTEMCGEVADGLLAHAFTTKRYFEEVTTPALMRGMERSGRKRSEFQLSAPIFVVTGDNEAELADGAVGTRKQIAFYGSTPAYRKVLDLHGLGDLYTDLHRLSLRGEWDAMASLIDDEVLDPFAVVAPLDQVAAKIRDRCNGVIDRVLVGFPSSVSEETVIAVLNELRQPEASVRSRPMSAPTIDDAAKVFADPKAYADEPKLHDALAHLRAHAPVSRVDAPNYRPFWAITKHADVMAIERANTVFTNSPRPVLMTAEADEQQAGLGISTLIHMDDPQHRVVRAIGADWFRPKAMRALKVRVDELAKQYVDNMMQAGTECDFVQEVAVNYPLYVIMSLLGLPESDFPRMLKYTQELFGNDDAELQRGASKEEQIGALLEMFQYFTELTASRRANPTEDLASAIANARVDDEPLTDVDTVSYYVIIATAGHDTTSAVISGGLHALIENPDQLARLRDNPQLMPLATEEMIRWVTPVKEFMRTAREDTTVRGVPITEGESVLLSYPSANRDEEIFDDPFRFDVGRDPNKHVAFGYGVHFCLGAALARMEVNSFFSELVPRLDSIELTGDPAHIATIFVGGLKHLPIRYSLK
jgi:probable F420-dependent oxidoreductase